jgi:uncharacterized membrane protein YebE (DUF533 family)
MNWREDLAGESPEMDFELDQALEHFKASMDAWSDAALARPRMMTKAPVRHNWRPAAVWALGCLLAVGSLAGAAYEMVHRQEMAKQAAQRDAQKRKAAAQQAALPAPAPTEKKASAATVRKLSAGAQDGPGGQDENLLASVDKDVSQQVPAAMEPLAQLMDSDGAQ